jgi:hypothetical protein
MKKTECIDVNTKEEKSPEIDSTKVPLNCPGQTTKGLENSCKCGAFLVPLCIVI